MTIYNWARSVHIWVLLNVCKCTLYEQVMTRANLVTGVLYTKSVANRKSNSRCVVFTRAHLSKSTGEKGDKTTPTTKYAFFYSHPIQVICWPTNWNPQNIPTVFIAVRSGANPSARHVLLWQNHNQQQVKLKQEMRTSVAAIEEVSIICARLTEKPNGCN